MSGQNPPVFQLRNQQDSYQQEHTGSSPEDVIEAPQIQPPGQDSLHQDIPAQPFYHNESDSHQANVLPSPSTMSSDVQPQQKTRDSLPPTRNSETERETIAESMPASLTVQEAVIEDASILRQEQLVCSEQPLCDSAGSKSELHHPMSLIVYAPFWKVWWKEILCLMASIALLIAIIVVLAIYDDQSLPSSRSKITLNTVIALFTTLAKGAFMLPVSTALSQSKFTWFLKSRPLHDFHVFDQASRGWSGSMKMLFRVRFKHTVALGAILMIVSILSSPVTQLAINYRQRDDPAPGESARIFTIDEISLDERRLRRVAREASVKATMPDTASFEVPAPPQKSVCSTGNCDFEPYQSLGVCVDIANITSKLRVEPINNLTSDLIAGGNGRLTLGRKTWNISLSSKYGLLHQSSLVFKGDLLEGSDTFGFSNRTRLLKTRISSYFFIYTSPLRPDKILHLPSQPDGAEDMYYSITDFEYEAVEVMFHLCVQTFETKVHKGVEQTTITNTISQIDDPSKGIIMGPKCIVSEEGNRMCGLAKETDGLVAQITPPNAGTRRFSASYASMWCMVEGLSWVLQGEAELSLAHLESDGFFWVGNFALAWLDDVLYTNQTIFNSTQRAIYLGNFLTNMATSISSALRTTHHQDERPGVVVIEGTPLKEVSFVHISWGWISFLAVEITAATLLLTIIIAAQSAAYRKRGPENVYIPADVKDSALASLVVLSNECREALSDGLQPAAILQKTSKKLQVTLRGNEFELAGDPEGPSSPSGKYSTQEVSAEEHAIPKKRFLGRIFTSMRA
ncbi:uncharacterized protein CCOS01_16598 [Colletotrichum costaricense]|uniref:Uncharacterized protein n=1 Tax=Colletotrichum costaricense TaxID=1209916 RepID=A0AAI9YF07_9PEZI|nr:uncharacterized protein CCOS01_16598 [Colletotrichum costaricense]KAK1505908.1 hypothetical protein CCOS01_16598 [Colletotrichum costaricense]